MSEIVQNNKHEPKIVVVGGGTGLSILLRGLKKFTRNITAIVTVADDGGGSGILREDLGMLPPGDIRSCLLALSNVEPTMMKLLNYRFTEGNLKGQSFGNLFIAAMNGIYGNFEVAIKEMSNVLAVTGNVLPMTIDDVKLYAKLENGMILEGESNIPNINGVVKSKIDYVYLKPEECFLLEESILALRDADAIILGPGSLYTSIIPNLLVKGMIEEIVDSKAIKIYIPNIMTQPGETDNYNLLNHVESIIKHTNQNIIDYVLVNIENIPKKVLKKYYQDESLPVKFTEEHMKKLQNYDIDIIFEKLIDIKKDYIRHDAEKISQIVMDLINKEIDNN